MESNPAKVFAFAMAAVEIFTRKAPLHEKQNNQVAAQRISRGGRPEMPTNAQEVGLTGEIRKALKSCWQQNPNE
jgi:hypothetical protein